jgi:hypothetical protein
VEGVGEVWKKCHRVCRVKKARSVQPARQDLLAPPEFQRRRLVRRLTCVWSASTATPPLAPRRATRMRSCYSPTAGPQGPLRFIRRNAPQPVEHGLRQTILSFLHTLNQRRLDDGDPTPAKRAGEFNNDAS